MKKSILLGALFTTLLTSGYASAQSPNKMTYEKAMKSNRASTKEYRDASITPEESQRAWDSYRQKPKEIDGGSAGQLKEVWTGSAVSVPVTWGNGDYYIEITFGHKNQGGSAWITIDDSSIKKNVAIPSPFQYEGNYHILYETGTLSAQSDRASGTPKITHISKLPSK